MSESSPGFFEEITRTLQRLRAVWQSSLTTRVISAIAVSGLLGFMLVGGVVVNQLRTAVFNSALETNIEQFSANVSAAQERFNAVSSQTSGQIQQIANDVVASMYDPPRGVMGSVLVRSEGQMVPTVSIVEPSTASATQVRALITSDIREATVESGDIAYTSVEVPGTGRDTAPGLLVGKTITIPGAGEYEVYAAYSLESQEDLLRTNFRVLTFAIVALMVLLGLIGWLMMRLVLRPVSEASAGAHQLAEGEFSTRMDVRGNDELAQLARSFNQMAVSLEDQFTRMERMSKVQTDFVSAVSHELRSPVTTIRMAGQLIYDKRAELPPTLRRSAELQHDQLRNLDAMLSDLLEISRYDAGGASLATREADIAQIAADVINMAKPLADDNGVVVDLHIEGDTLAVVEPRRIERVLRNLVVNAVEHAERNPIHVRVVGGDDAVAVEVMDNGVGMTDEHVSHVFERFWRADASRVRKSGGTGLGLTIAREDALIHGGTLEAAGKIGVGSTFLLTIPRSPGAPYTRPLKLAAPEPITTDQIAIEPLEGDA